MPNMTEILSAIERRAERAIVQELRLMTQEILTMRTQLTLEHRAHADALLLKLDHLERCQQVDLAPPAPIAMASTASPSGPDIPELRLETLEALQPSHYLVHFYSHDIGELERVALTETLSAAAQVVRLHLAERPRPVWQLTYDATSGGLDFLSGDDLVLASVQPCEPTTPPVEPIMADACTALAEGDLSALRHLFVTAADRPARLVA